MRPENLTGQKFARLTALSYQGNKNWLCRCECGKETIVRASHLKSGNVQSCGCVRRENNKDKLIDLVGKRFGRLTVLSYQDHKRWLCRCECGTEKIIETKHLRTGATVSCGCYRIANGKRMQIKNGIAEVKPIANGTRFGRLIILNLDSIRENASFYLCQCDCGNRKSVSRSALLSGDTQSCGCLHKEVSRTQAKKNFTKHGLSGEPWYISFLRRKRKDIDSGWTKEMDALLFKIQPRCVICGASKRLEVDHVIPFSKGGRLEPGNVVILCRTCNQTKCYKDMERLPKEWQEKILRAASGFKTAWENQN